MTASVPSLHVIFGAGQIGGRIATLLRHRGERVRVVARGKSSRPPPGVEFSAGDASDHAFAAEAARGASVVYDCMNPPYQLWKDQLIPIAAGALHAAARAGAPLIAIDSLYMYGLPSGPMTEDTPVRPNSRKGLLRAELAELRLAADRRGDVRVAIARASDYFGPSLPYSWWSDRFFHRVLSGKTGECLGDPDMPHSYTYADDVARALILLGEREDALGKVWHVPTVPAESTRALAQRIGNELGIPIEVTHMSRLLLRALGVFNPFMRELPELAYQWEVPFVIDDTRFRTTFGVGPTPIEEQVATTVDWARERYATRRAA